VHGSDPPRLAERRHAPSDPIRGRARLRARGGGWLLGRSATPSPVGGQIRFAPPTPADPDSAIDASRWLRLRAEASRWWGDGR
jgi:hypothetical protein